MSLYLLHPTYIINYVQISINKRYGLLSIKAYAPASCIS